MTMRQVRRAFATARKHLSADMTPSLREWARKHIKSGECSPKLAQIVNRSR